MIAIEKRAFISFGGRSIGRSIVVRFIAAGLALLLVGVMLTPTTQSAAIAWAASNASESVAGEDTSASYSASSVADLPEYYLANDGFLTPVRLQNPWGSCWAFAIAAAVESSILKAQYKLDSSKAPGVALLAGDYSEPKLTGIENGVDISERAIGWFAHELQTEAGAGKQAGEGNQRSDAGDYLTQMAGGSFTSVEAMLTAGQAFVLEASAPYEYNGYAAGASVPWFSNYDNEADASRRADWSLPDGLRTQSDVGWVVTDTLRLKSPSNSQFMNEGNFYKYEGYDAAATTKIKQTLADVGAVAIAIAADAALPMEVVHGNSAAAQPSENMTFSTWSQYNASEKFVDNHAVTIVGWDDTYSAANFAGTESGQPPADGAWLCKNNWGSDALYDSLGGAANATHWGIAENGAATGFFWLSYYDHSIAEPTAYVVAPANSDAAHDDVYQYDYLATSEFLTPISYEQEVTVANVFTPEDTELLTAVSAQTFGVDDKVKIQVYSISDFVEGNEADIFNDARCVFETESVFADAGFHTIELEDPVLLPAGQRFAVAQSISTGADPEYRYLNLEAAFIIDPAVSGLETFATVVANPGETYVNLSGDGWTTLAEFNTWYADFCEENGYPLDMKFGNALIKAYTDGTTMSSGGNQAYQLVKL